MGPSLSRPRCENEEEEEEDLSQFVSLGMVVLDELRFPSHETMYDVPGGSGAYGTLGARLAAAGRSKSVECIVLTGDDFPQPVLDELRSWDLNLVIHAEKGKKSTRGLLQYEDDAFGRKTFRYTTQPLQPSPRHLEGQSLLRSTCFHLLSRPEDLQTQTSDLLTLRSRCSANTKPLLVWEPAPPHCQKVSLDAHLAACQLVDVFSPNHLELLALFQDDKGPSVALDRSIIEQGAHEVLNTSLRKSKIGVKVVIRAGEHGCLTLSSSSKSHWLPACYSPRVIDPTGAGNAFLGAFALILSETGNMREAAIYGSVAASYAVEQCGLPTKSDSGGSEAWNGSIFNDRLEEYRSRIIQSTPKV